MRGDWKGPYNRRLAKRRSERGRRLANIRWQRFRETAHMRPEPDPKMARFYRFQIGFRDVLTGDEGWKPLKSVRNAAMTAKLILKYAS